MIFCAVSLQYVPVLPLQINVSYDHIPCVHPSFASAIPTIGSSMQRDLPFPLSLRQTDVDFTRVRGRKSRYACTRQRRILAQCYCARLETYMPKRVRARE